MNKLCVVDLYNLSPPTDKKTDENRTVEGLFKSQIDNKKIYYKRFFCNKEDSDETFHFVMIHDVLDHHERYQDLYYFLEDSLECNFIFSYIDLRGHGLSGGRRVYLKEFEYYTKDLVTFMNEICSEDKTYRAQYLIGQGMGALVSLDLLLHYKGSLTRPCTGMVLSNPLLKLESLAISYLNTPISKLCSFVPKLRIPAFFQVDDLTHNVEKQKKYKSDALIASVISLNFLRAIIATGQKMRTLAYYIDIPTLFLFSNKNVVADTKVGKLFAKGVPRGWKKVIEYDQMRHDLFNEIGSEKVFEDILDWIVTTAKVSGNVNNGKK